MFRLPKKIVNPGPSLGIAAVIVIGPAVNDASKSASLLVLESITTANKTSTTPTYYMINNSYCLPHKV